MTTKEKAKFIQRVDSILQEMDGVEAEDLDNRLGKAYNKAIGNEDGWEGIAEKEPEVIENLYPVVLAFENENIIE